MSMTAISLLSSMMSEDANGPLRGAVFGQTAALDGLVASGIVVPAGHVEVVVCNECIGTHDVETLDGSIGWMCEQTGWIDAEFRELAAYEVNTARFVELLAECMDTRAGITKPQGGLIVWRVGSFRYQDHRVAVYFAVEAAAPERFNDVHGWLKGEPGADGVALLTNDGRDVSRLSLPQYGSILQTDNCVEICSNGQLTLDREWLARRVLPENLLGPKRRGRPNSAECLAAELIRELDHDGSMRTMGVNERHRALNSAAKKKYGDETTLSKPPCNRAWDAYILTNPSN